MKPFSQTDYFYPMHKQISSLQNKSLRHLIQLQEKSRIRRKEQLFPVEGRREIHLALQGGFGLRELFYCPGLFPEKDLSPLLDQSNSEVKITAISPEVYQKLAYRGSTEGLIAVFQSRETPLTALKLPQKAPLILVAEAPEKPGNIGALLRTADAAGLDAVIIANPRTDLYNPNIIRSSVGAVFTTPIATGTTGEIIRFLQQKQIGIYAAALQASQVYSQVDLTGPAAMVVGTEATGLEQAWLENSTRNLIIPMRGVIDSMNLSVAAGILIFEARRQRSINPKKQTLESGNAF